MWWISYLCSLWHLGFCVFYECSNGFNLFKMVFCRANVLVNMVINMKGLSDSFLSCVPQHCGSAASLGGWSQTQRSPDHWALMEEWGAANVVGLPDCFLTSPHHTHPPPIHTQASWARCAEHWGLRGKLNQGRGSLQAPQTHTEQTELSKQENNRTMIQFFMITWHKA